MTGRELQRVVGYAVSVLALVTGVLVLAGRVLAPAPGKLRYTFGIVLVCYGVYRFLLVRMSRRTGAADNGERGRERWRAEDRWDRAEDRWENDSNSEEP